MTNLVSEPHFGEVRGDAQPLLMARWKVHGRLSIRLNWSFFAIRPLQFRGYEAKCVQLGCFHRGSTSLHSNFTGQSRPPSTLLASKKLETLGYPTVKTASLCIPSFWRIQECDGRTDRRTDGFVVAYTARRAV